MNEWTNENKSINQSIYQIKVRENRRGSETWIIQIHWLHQAHKTQNEDNSDTLATPGTHDTGRKQLKTKTKKKHNAEN